MHMAMCAEGLRSPPDPPEALVSWVPRKQCGANLISSESGRKEETMWLDEELYWPARRFYLERSGHGIEFVESEFASRGRARVVLEASWSASAEEHEWMDGVNEGAGWAASPPPPQL